MFRKLGAVVLAVMAALALSAAPAAAATSYVSGPLKCDDGIATFHMTVWYTVESGHQLSINQVVINGAWFDGWPDRAINFRSAGLGRLFTSDGFYQPNRTGPINQPSQRFYWPVDYHVATRSEPAYVDVVAEFHDAIDNIYVTNHCRAGFYA